jgi:acyl-CoA thioester hydrolase
VKIRVYYEDTDTGGIVYHTNYINFCERARSEAFFSRNLSPEVENGGFVAKKIQAEYLKPAVLGDMLEVKTELKEMKAASFTLTQTIHRDNEKLFTMDITLAFLDEKGKVKRLGDTKELLLSLF